MFGKPEWFREQRRGWGLVPIAWQGWAYAVSWAAVLGAPFALLVAREQPIESVIWLGVAGAALLWDVRGVRKALRPPLPEDVFYIGDDQADAEPVATRNFNLQLRR